jgi:hypothetical protein
MSEGGESIWPLTHGRDTHQRSADAGIETPSQAVASNAFAHAVDGALIHTLVGRLEADLDEIKGMAHDDGTNASKAAGRKRPQLRQATAGSGLGLGLDLCL